MRSLDQARGIARWASEGKNAANLPSASAGPGNSDPISPSSFTSAECLALIPF